MTNQVNEQLKKMLNDYSELNDSNNQLFQETLKDIDKLENKEVSKFLKQSAIDARSGKLDVKGFIESSKKFKTL